MRKYLIEKRKSEMVPKPGLPKKHSNKGIQTKKKDPIRCKSTKCYNECYKYKITECLEQHDRLQHGKEKLQELKERNYKVIIRKRKHICWYNRGDNIYNFMEGMPTNEKWQRSIWKYTRKYSMKTSNLRM